MGCERFDAERCRMLMRLSKQQRLIPALAAAALAGCASVATHVTVLDETHKYPPTEHVVVLFDYPPAAHVKIALIEARGTLGGSEAELLEEARDRARALGADAIVRLEVNAVYQPPVRIYDPAYGNPFYSRYRYPYRTMYFPPAGVPAYPFDDYRWVGGGTVQTLKAVAIRYTREGQPPSPP